MTDRLRRSVLYGCLACAALAVALYSQWPALRDPFVIADDARQHLYWMVLFHNPGLFDGDIFVPFARSLSPCGFQALFWILTWFGDPIAAGKILSLVLFCGSAIMLFVIGSAMQGVSHGMLLYLFFLASPLFMGTMAGGLPRAFAYPLLLCSLGFLLRLRLDGALFVAAVSLLLYPLVFPVLIAPIFFVVICRGEKTGIAGMNKRLPWAFFLLVAVIFLVTAYAKYARPAYWGPALSLQEIELNPAFAAGGRAPRQDFVLPRYLFQSMARIGYVSPLLVVVWGIAVLSDVMRKRYEFLWRHTVATGFLAASGLACALLAPLLPAPLCLVQARYIQYTAALCALFIVARAVMFLFWLVPSRWWKCVVMGCAVIVIFLTGSRRIKPGLGVGVWMSPGEREIVHFVSHLPPSVLVAAPPRHADNISSFAHKRIFLSYELAYPLFEGYAKEIAARARAFYAAYYAETPEPVRDFVKKYNIDYLIVDRGSFSDKVVRGKRFYFEPFDREIVKMLSKRQSFVLKNPSQTETVFSSRDGQWYVLHFDLEAIKDRRP